MISSIHFTRSNPPSYAVSYESLYDIIFPNIDKWTQKTVSWVYSGSSREAEELLELYTYVSVKQ